MRRDMLSVLEAAYRDSPEEQWREELTESGRVLDHGAGLVFALTRFRDPGAAMEYATLFGTARQECFELFRATAEAVTEPLISQMLHSSGKSASMVMGREQLPSLVARMGPDRGMEDCIGIHGLVAPLVTFGVYLPLPQMRAVGREETRRYRLLGAHLGAAWRARTSRARDEAILEPSGRVAHAEASAVSSREVLSRRAREIDAARTQRGRSDVDEALALWKGLVAGEWSLVERFESDGKRFFVARRNAPELGTVLRLTPTEARVLRLCALGMSQKYVAYTLGLSAAGTHRALVNARAKLGLRSQSELLATLGSLAQAAQQAEDAELVPPRR